MTCLLRARHLPFAPQNTVGVPMINLTIDDTVLAELLSQIDWREHPKLARLVRSALAKASRTNGLGRPALLTGGMKASIARRHRAGEGVAALAAEYGVHRGTVYRALAEKDGRRPYRKAVRSPISRRSSRSSMPRAFHLSR